jgi:hypothetical protein
MSALVFLVGRFIGWAVSEGEIFDKDWPYWIKRCVATFFVCLFLHGAVPTKQTVLLITGSEIGQKLVESDTVKGVVNPGLNLLKTWIKKETDSLLPKESKEK